MRRQLAKKLGVFSLCGGLLISGQGKVVAGQSSDLDAYNKGMVGITQQFPEPTLRQFFQLTYGSKLDDVIKKAQAYNARLGKDTASYAERLLDRPVPVKVAPPGDPGGTDHNIAWASPQLGTYVGAGVRHELFHVAQQSFRPATPEDVNGMVAKLFAKKLEPGKVRGGMIGDAGWLAYNITAKELEPRMSALKGAYFKATGILIDSPSTALQALVAIGANFDSNLTKGVPPPPRPLTKTELSKAKEIPEKFLDVKDILNIINGCRNHLDRRLEIMGGERLSVPASKNNPELHRYLFETLTGRLPGIVSDNHLDFGTMT